MAHFAQIDSNNLVVQVVVIDNADITDMDGNESEFLGQKTCRHIFGSDTVWVQTSYNASIRKNYASVGYTWRQDLDGFVPPQPFASWTLNEETCRWEPPVPHPNDGPIRNWNEETQSWDEVNG